LAIDGDHVSHKTLQQIKSDFEESSLPYRIDLIDMDKIDHVALKEHIERVGKSIFQTN